MRFYILVIYISIPLIFISQIKYYSQGFENNSNICPDNWSYVGGNRNNQHARTGFHSVRLGRSGESNSLILNAVDISQLNNAYLRMNHSVLGGSGPGLDTREGAVFMVSINGGAFVIISRVSGFGDHNYPWTATGGSISSSSGCISYQTPNTFIYNIPNGSITISIKIISVGRNSSTCSSFNNAMNTGTASNFDRVDEGIYLDDLEIWADAPNPLPTISVCENQSFSIGTNNSNSAFSYNWTGPNNFSSTIQNPLVSSSATLSMSGIYTNNVFFATCQLVTLNQIVNVNMGPNVTINGGLTICNGSSTSLTASGALNYQWSNNLGSNASVLISNTGTYSVTASNGSNCTSQTFVTINSINSPSIIFLSPP